jgi:hypothetical protein
MIVLISWQSGEFYKKIINIRLPYLNTDDTFFLPFKFLYIKRIQNFEIVQDFEIRIVVKSNKIVTISGFKL